MMVARSFPRKVDKIMSVDELIQKLGLGIACGFSEILVESVASPGNACLGSMVFISARGELLRETVKSSQASIFVVSEDVELDNQSDYCYILTNDPLAWYIKAINFLLHKLEYNHISNLAIISDDVVIGKNVSIGPGTVVERSCVIGDDSKIGANVFIGSDTILSEGCFLQNNVSIGSIGLGYHTDIDGYRMLFPHLGRVILGKFVVIGASSVVVRGQLKDTNLGDFVRLGNLVNVGHNVSIGKNTIISSSACVAGGVAIGEGCNIGIGANINSKIILGDKVIIGMGSVVTKNIASNSSVFGNPARAIPTMNNF